MKKLLIPLLLLSLHGFGQTITSVAIGEYATAFKTDKKEVFQTNWEGSAPVIRKVADNIEWIYGGQYHDAMVSTDGTCYTLQGGSVNRIASGVSKAYGLYTLDKSKPCTIMIMTDGTLSIVGDWMGIRSFSQPAGKVFKHLAVYSNTNIGSCSIYAIATDGTLWVYKYGSSVPAQVAGRFNAVTCIGSLVAIATTDTDIFVLAGAYNASIVGMAWNNKQQTSIKSSMFKFPLKEIGGTYNSLHIVDADNNLFGIGSNAMGEVGNGIGKVWEGANAYNQWDWNSFFLLAGWTKIEGKFKNLQTCNIVAPYLYIQDLDNNWYSWGRNKNMSLGNGVTLGINDYAAYPNNGDIWKPTLVRPLEQKWTVYPYVAGKKLPNNVLPPAVVVPPVVSYTQAYVDSLNAQINTLTQSNTAQVSQISILTNSNAAKDAKITAAVKALQ